MSLDCDKKLFRPWDHEPNSSSSDQMSGKCENVSSDHHLDSEMSSCGASIGNSRLFANSFSDAVSPLLSSAASNGFSSVLNSMSSFSASNLLIDGQNLSSPTKSSGFSSPFLHYPLPVGSDLDLISRSRETALFLHQNNQNTPTKSLPNSTTANASTKPANRQRPKRFRCPHCNVAFSNNGQLKGHIRTHTGRH